MARTVALGIQDFGDLIQNDYFYVDKTGFIREWWENGDSVTLLTRPRRFGKTLNMSMVEWFFSVKYKGQGDVFEGLSIWEDEKYRQLQGSYPVIFLSFASVKETDYENARRMICEVLEDLYLRNHFLLDSGILEDADRDFFKKVSMDMGEVEAAVAVRKMAGYLMRYYGKKVIILLDEYDTPMQEAYVHGYWEEMVAFIRKMFNATFKTNPYLDRALMTGITRVSRESMFSDLNNLNVVTTTSDIYMDSFAVNSR